MKMASTRMIALSLLVAAGCLEAFAETSVKLEEKAAKKMAAANGSRTVAIAEYRAAAARRIAEEKQLYAKAKKEELEIEADAMATDDDAELLPGASNAAAQMKLDAEALHYLQTAVDYDFGAKPFACDRYLAKAKGVKGVSKKVTAEIEKFRMALEKDRDATEVDPPAPNPDVVKANPLKDAQSRLEAAIAAKKPDKVLAGLWSEVGYEAFRQFRPELCAQARDEIAKLKKQQPGRYAGRWVTSIRTFENLKTFPKAENETAAPKSLKEMGVKEKHTIVVGELDWDAEDATKCVEDAIASGATTLVFEDKGSPWYVKSIVPRSNQRLVFKKGVKVLMDKVSKQLVDKSPMILLKDVENVIIEGEGGPDDVYVGKYADYAERTRLSKDYGGSGLDILGAKNCVIRNITFGANSTDGVCIGSGANSSQDIWLENLVLRDNYRQAMSVVDAIGLYCRNVSFLNTIGGDPMCGIDFEPEFETYANADCYFYDCTFGGNAGAAVNWSSSSFYPVTCHMKRCHFEKARNCGQITVFARCGVYLGNDVKAPSKLVFEDCDMACNTDSFPLKIENASFFDIEVKNFKVKDIGPHDPNRKAVGNSPITFNLARSYGKGINDYQKRCGGRIHVEGLEVEGWAKHPVIEFRDRIGTYSVGGISGSATMNGQKIDLSTFSYEAPEIGLEDLAKFSPEDYLPPAKTAAANPAELPVGFSFGWKHAWFEAEPVFRALYFDDGAWQMKKIQTGVTELGLERFPVAYYCRGRGSTFRFSQKERGKAYTFYFEVPGGRKPCTLKVLRGVGKLRNAKGETVRSFEWTGSSQYATCQSASDASEIWSMTMESVAEVRFFAPFSGIIAESPEALPIHP